MAKCIKRMITCTRKISIPMPNTKEIDGTKKNGMERTKCIKEMISCTLKLNVLILLNTKKIDEAKQKGREMAKHIK